MTTKFLRLALLGAVLVILNAGCGAMKGAAPPPPPGAPAHPAR